MLYEPNNDRLACDNCYTNNTTFVLTTTTTAPAIFFVLLLLLLQKKGLPTGKSKDRAIPLSKRGTAHRPLDNLRTHAG